MKYRCLQCDHDGPCGLDLIMVIEPINTPHTCPFGGAAKWELVEPEQKYGCHIAVDYGVKPHACFETCNYGSHLKSKEECKYWRVIK